MVNWPYDLSQKLDHNVYFLCLIAEIYYYKARHFKWWPMPSMKSILDILPFFGWRHYMKSSLMSTQTNKYYVLGGTYIYFFLISNLKVYWKNTAPYIGNVLKRQKHQENKVKCSSNLEREIQEKEGKTKHHSRRVEKKKDLNSRMDRSRSSKLLEFRSRQIHHIK